MTTKKTKLCNKSQEYLVKLTSGNKFQKGAFINLKTSKFFKLVANLTVFTVIIGFCIIPHTKVKADSPVQILNFQSTDTSQSFTLNSEGTNIDYSIQQIDDSTVSVHTVTDNVEEHVAIYDTNNNYLTLDGQQIPIEKTTEGAIYIDDPNPMAYSLSVPDSTYSATSTSDWDPVFVTTYKSSFKQVIFSIGVAATIVGGIISGAAIIGVSIATSTVASTIGNWASVIGLRTLLVGYVIDGYVQWSLYKTKNMVSTGYGSKQFAYRYQNIKSHFDIRGAIFDQTFVSYGSWWFGQKPY